MRILVAGATGAIGSRLLPILVAAGHEVVGLTRTPGKAAGIERAGAKAAVGDGLDPDFIRRVVAAARPDVIVHQMTALRGTSDLRRFDRSFALSNRLRTDGLRWLVEAGLEAGTRRFVSQSFCGWPYRSDGAWTKSEEDPLDDHPVAQMRESLAAIRYLEETMLRIAGSGATGIALRYGTFYGPATGLFESSMVTALRRRLFPLVTPGTGWWSFIHVDDAVAATERAIAQGSSGIYNVVDAEPAPVREWLPALAEAVGARPPIRLPGWSARLLAGDVVLRMMTAVRAGLNSKAVRDLGWHLRYPSWRQGFLEVAASMGLSRSSPAVPHHSRNEQ
jgi:2-alkyl-3-oxoalkanoate reductase